MYTQELKIPKDIEIKFYRLSQPSLNISNFPLSGIYQNLDSIEDKGALLKNKFSNFDVTRMGIDNLFTLSSSFGKVFLGEKLDGLITFSNTSDNFVVIKDLEIFLLIEALNEEKNNKKILDIKLPPDGIIIKPKQGHTVNMSISLDYVSKYTIDINLRVRSSAYNSEYNTLMLKNVLVKEKTKDYQIVNGNVEALDNKKLTFDVNYPFKISEKFHNYQMNICYIETKIKNNTIYPLTIFDIVLSPKNKKNLKIYDLLLNNNIENMKLTLVQSLQEINNNEINYYDKNLKNKNFNSKYITIETDEEINLLFKNNNPNLFGVETEYILEIKWLNLFDLNPKKYTYEFQNILSTFNDYYKITVIEKPKDNINKNQKFNVVLKLETKNPEKKYVINLSQEPLKDNDKSNDREIEIIDIVEKKIELNQHKQSNNFILICKSDILGKVYLPRLKFLLYEDNNQIPIENVYDSLLFFNCIEN